MNEHDCNELANNGRAEFLLLLRPACRSLAYVSFPLPAASHSSPPQFLLQQQNHLQSLEDSTLWGDLSDTTPKLPWINVRWIRLVTVNENAWKVIQSAHGQNERTELSHQSCNLLNLHASAL